MAATKRHTPTKEGSQGDALAEADVTMGDMDSNGNQTYSRVGEWLIGWRTGLLADRGTSTRTKWRMKSPQSS